MFAESRTRHALTNREDDGNDWVPLHILEEKYGAFYSANEPILRAESPDAKKGKIVPAGDGRKRNRGIKEKQNAPRLTAADMIRGFEPFNLECLDDVASEKRNFAQLKQETAMHNQFLSSLREMQCLAVELDLSFQSVKSLTSSVLAKSFLMSNSEVSRAVEGDEFVLDIELQKNVNVHSIVLRSPPSWELHQEGGPRKARHVWGVRSKAPHVVGDNAHTLILELAERAPEVIKLRRLKKNSNQNVTRPNSARREVSGRSSPDCLPSVPKTLNSLAILDTSGRASDPEIGSSSSTLASLSSQCKMLERNFMEKYDAHYRNLLEQIRAPCKKEVEKEAAKTHSRKDVAKTNNADLLAGASQTRAKAKEYAQEYVREIRSALRLLGPILPDAVRVIEAAVKGLVVSLDASLSIAWQHAEDLQVSGGQLQNDAAESDMLKSTIRNLQKDIQKLKDEKDKLTSDHQSECAGLRRKIQVLEQEKEKLIPDQSDLDGVAGLMTEHNALLEEAEEETAKQALILERMTNYTINVVGDATQDPKERKSRANGRVVELLNGELLLRPHNVAEEGAQVVETDLLTLNQNLPIRLRTPSARHIINAFENREIPVVKMAELLEDIDKIYNMKIQSDQDADLAGLPRSELIDFVVEYHLETTRSVQKAQARTRGILKCLQFADQQSLPLKVSLFARFLCYCEYRKALPLPVLNVVLHAKRLAMASMLREKPDGNNSGARGQPRLTVRPGKETTADLKEKDASLVKEGKEAQLGVALAYEAATKALPSHIPALRELFVGLSKHAEIEGDQKRPMEREMLILSLLLHDRLHRENAGILRELITRAELRGVITTEEFRDAVRDAGVPAIDDNVWRPTLTEIDNPSNISSDLFIDYLGGGSPARLPRATVSESAFLSVVTDAFMADYEDRMKHVQGHWLSCARTQGTNGTLSFADFGSVVQSEEPTTSAPMIRALYLTSVEMSRSCTQLHGDPCLPTGTLDPVSNEYGGEVVTFNLFSLAALKCGLFSKDFSPSATGFNATGESFRSGAISPSGGARLQPGVGGAGRGNRGNSPRRDRRRG